MTDSDLNGKALELVCELAETIRKFQVLRDAASDDAWDGACNANVFLDVLTEVEAWVDDFT